MNIVVTGKQGTASDDERRLDRQQDNEVVDLTEVTDSVRTIVETPHGREKVGVFLLDVAEIFTEEHPDSDVVDLIQQLRAKLRLT